MKKIIAFISSALLVFALAAIVLAHAEIESCVPAIDGTVETAPDKIVCMASEGMKLEGSSLQVFDANGAQVDKKDSAVDLNDPDRKTISVSLDTAKMKDGVYTVKWTTVSADDGDEESGEFKFTVGHAMVMEETPTPQAEEHSAVTHPNDDHSIGIAMVNGKEVTLKIIAPKEDATLPIGDVKIEATIEGVELGQDGLHLHFFVDEKLQGMGEGAQTTYTVNLEAGKHELMVTLADHDHEDLNNAHVHVEVEAATTAAAATPAPAPANTLPATGGEVNYGLFALLAVLGLSLIGIGAFAFARR